MGLHNLHNEEVKDIAIIFHPGQRVGPDQENYLVELIIMVCYIQITNVCLVINLFYDLFIYILILFICRAWWGHGRCECTTSLDSRYLFSSPHVYRTTFLAQRPLVSSKNWIRYCIHPTIHSSSRLSVQVHQLNPHVFIIESGPVACPQACPRKNLSMEICMTFIFLVKPS